MSKRDDIRWEPYRDYIARKKWEELMFMNISNERRHRLFDEYMEEYDKAVKDVQNSNKSEETNS